MRNDEYGTENSLFLIPDSSFRIREAPVRGGFGNPPYELILIRRRSSRRADSDGGDGIANALDNDGEDARLR